MRILPALFLASLLLPPVLACAQGKPPITIDEFMNATEIRDARMAPDGSAVVIATVAPDWQQDRFKEDLWLWTRATGAVTALTGSGHDSAPQWSPDGRYIAFISDRPLSAPAADDEKDKTAAEEPGRIWLIPSAGGEAFPLYREKLDVHAFAWSPDGTNVEFSTTEVRAKDVEDAEKKEWKDVIRWREQERGDVLLALPVDAAVRATMKMPAAHAEDKTAGDTPQYPLDARLIAHSHLQIGEIAPQPGGDKIAFVTEPISHRVENPADVEIFVVAAKGGDAAQLTHNEGAESHLHWATMGDRIYFMVPKGSGSIEGPYRDVQGRLYSLDLASPAPRRLGGSFNGSWEDFTVTTGGTLIATGLAGVNQAVYRIDGEKFEPVAQRPGTYEHVQAGLHGTGVVFTHSTITDPAQVFVAADLSQIDSAKPITQLNTVFGERAQVEWQPYKWKSDDGIEVEGVLIYPPGKRGEKHLRMFTLIHGGPEDADGNHFGADWYDWATLAAANGWLVFRPNYRGSTGYGDAFMLSIQPHLVSGPGRDILSGVDALVKEGIADPAHLTIGGYSYGGYMTNWLITQTTRFKAAVTGAGAVEHAANWGNDDLTYDDAWYLSGTPWEKPDLYQSEAALFRMDKVTTPTHIVGGNADVRVSYFEQVLLERALQRLNVPHSLLVFPGENHPLDKDPWHGYIKVREELKWLAKYGEN